MAGRGTSFPFPSQKYLELRHQMEMLENDVNSADIVHTNEYFVVGGFCTYENRFRFLPNILYLADTFSGCHLFTTRQLMSLSLRLSVRFETSN